MTACLQAVILAGGLGTRLKPVTEKIPKALVDIEGRPFIFYQLELLMKNGIKEVVLLLGHMGEMVEEVIATSPYKKNISFSFSYDGPELLGTAGSVRNSMRYLNDHFFLLYGDSYLECDYQKAYGKFVNDGKLGLMTVIKNNNQWDKSNVIFKDGEITFYSKKDLRPEMSYIDYGLSIFNRVAFSKFVPGSVKYDLADLFEQLLFSGQLSAFEVSKRFYEIGSFRGIEDFQSFVASGRHR